MNNLDTEVVIKDGHYQYFRPSMISMQNEVKQEVQDYKDAHIDSSRTVLDSYKSLTLIDHPYDRLCFVRKRINDLGCKNNANIADIMILLGIEHKLQAQMTNVDEFISHYQSLIENICTRLNKKRYTLARIFQMRGYIEKNVLPMVQKKDQHEHKLEKFEKEKKEIKDLLQFIKGKILYLSDKNIAKIGMY